MRKSISKSLFIFFLINRSRDFAKRNASLTVSLIRSLILLSSVSDFSLAKDGEWGWLSRVRTRYREVVREGKHIESELYSNGSLNNYWSEFKKGFWRCSYIAIIFQYN
jgi:hypothetical protein